MAAEDRGPPMHAHIGMMRALNGHVERVFDPSPASRAPDFPRSPHFLSWASVAVAPRTSPSFGGRPSGGSCSPQQGALIIIITTEISGFPAGPAASLSLIGIGVMYGKLMLPDVLLPKLLDGCPATFERSEGLNDFVVRVNGADRTISREAWCSLLDQTRSAPPTLIH